MKLIIAIIQPEKLSDVKKALFNAEVHKMTVSNVIGGGQQGGYKEAYGALWKSQSFEESPSGIAVNEDFVKPTVEAIIKAPAREHW
jgi:nitrogen regulatory protein P-II 1